MRRNCLAFRRKLVRNSVSSTSPPTTPLRLIHSPHDPATLSMATMIRPLPLRKLLQCPATLRPSLYKTLSPALNRNYHSYESESPSPYPPSESSILSAALSHVPTQGFTQSALRSGARDVGYLDASTNLFSRGEFEIVMYHLQTQRLALGGRIQFPEEERSVGRKVRALVLERLRGNVDANVVGRWQEVTTTPPDVRSVRGAD